MTDETMRELNTMETEMILEARAELQAMGGRGITIDGTPALLAIPTIMSIDEAITDTDRY